MEIYSQERIDRLIDNGIFSITGGALNNLNLTRKSLRHCDFYFCDFSFSNFNKADLGNAGFYCCDLTSCSFLGVGVSTFNIVSCVTKQSIFDGDRSVIQFSSGRHQALYRQWGKGGAIRIGCKEMTVKDWESMYEEIGLENGYGKKETMIYGEMIKAINNIHNNLTKGEE